jgi:hypothetical protein
MIVSGWEGFMLAWRYISAACVLVLSASNAGAQSFSCPIGKNAACLDYGDKVCSSRGKCVTSDAVCFDSYTCNFKGFVCKSDLDDVVENHDAVVMKYNTLVDAIGDVQRCVRDAENVNDAQSCFRRLP